MVIWDCLAIFGQLRCFLFSSFSVQSQQFSSSATVVYCLVYESCLKLTKETFPIDKRTSACPLLHSVLSRTTSIVGTPPFLAVIFYAQPLSLVHIHERRKCKRKAHKIRKRSRSLYCKCKCKCKKMKNCPFLVLSKVDPLQLATRKYVLHLNQNIDVVIIRLKIFLFFFRVLRQRTELHTNEKQRLLSFNCSSHRI